MVGTRPTVRCEVRRSRRKRRSSGTVRRILYEEREGDAREEFVEKDLEILLDVRTLGSLQALGARARTLVRVIASVGNA